MSDTVIIALVTFASGALGSLFGYLSSRYAAKSSIRQEAYRAYFDKRSTAYADCTEAFLHNAETGRSPQSVIDMCRAFSRASLFASKQTADMLTETIAYLSCAEEPDAEKVSELENRMYDAMRRDLRDYAALPAALGKARRQIRKQKPERGIRQ